MGRKPKYDKPMTSAERSRFHRERAKKEGAKVLHFSLDGEVVGQIDELVEFFELSGRAQVVSDLLKRPLYEAITMMKDWKSHPDMPTKDDESELNEAASYAKKIIWDGVCVKINKQKGKNN